VAVLAAFVLPFSISTSVENADSEVAELNAEAWSPARVAELQAEGRLIFVDFTAAWCVSCKVNEIRVLKTKTTQELFKETNTAQACHSISSILTIQ